MVVRRPADRVAWRQWLQAHGKPDAPVPTPVERRFTELFAPTAVVSGVGAATGTALVEICVVP